MTVTPGVARQPSTLVVATSEPHLADLVHFIVRKRARILTARSFRDLERCLLTLEPSSIAILEPLAGFRRAPSVRRLRRLTQRHILVVLADQSPDARAEVLLAGADEAVSYPLAKVEFSARLRALLRRERQRQRHEHVISLRELTIDLQNQTVCRGGEPVKLTPTEFRLLALLARHAGQPLTRREILQSIWQTSYVSNERVCDTYISTLRHKIEDDPRHPERLLTVRGDGYLLM
jgi:two-component system KDP operon response regulator KdpE